LILDPHRLDVDRRAFRGFQLPRIAFFRLLFEPCDPLLLGPSILGGAIENIGRQVVTGADFGRQFLGEGGGTAGRCSSRPESSTAPLPASRSERTRPAALPA